MGCTYIIIRMSCIQYVPILNLHTYDVHKNRIFQQGLNRIITHKNVWNS